MFDVGAVDPSNAVVDVVGPAVVDDEVVTDVFAVEDVVDVVTAESSPPHATSTSGRTSSSRRITVSIAADRTREREARR